MALMKKDSEHNFASNETIEGLKVTIATTLDIIEYLVNQLNFQYVLTAKLNQDCLEVRLLS